MADPCDVAIVGHGPVGAVLAIELGLRGLRVEVLERQARPYPLPRAVHYDHEIARVLQGAGVAAALEGATEPAPLYEWRNAQGEVLLRIGRNEQSLSGWPASTMFSQPELERVLDARVRELANVRVERGREVVSLREHADTVEIGLRDGGVRRARAVVGCDGAHSRVREQIGARWDDEGFAFDWLVVDVLPHDPADPLWRHEPTNWQLCDPARPTTLVSGGPGRRRWEFMRLPGETVDVLDREETAWRLLEPWGVHAANATLERHAVYRFRACTARPWRRGRRLIAGDAAHLMPPFAGQGLCSGLRDAANLAWKLDLVLGGHADPALLDSYESERRPHAEATIGFSIELGRVICVTDPDEAAARDLRMCAEARERATPVELPQIAAGPGCFAPGDAAAGELFVQGRVRKDGRSGRFDDVVGRGFVLLGAHGDPARALGTAQAEFFASLGGITAHVGAGAAVDDTDGTYGRWFARHDAALVLQRPDFHVFGTARDARGAGALVDALRAALGPARP